jgi:hypothetical protein
MRPVAAVLAIALVTGATAAQQPLSDARIALRCDDGKVLIVGDTIDDDAVAKLGADGINRLPEMALRAALSPGEATFEITTQGLKALAPKGAPGFQIGARWHLYPGPGTPVSVTIDQLVLLYHGNGNQYFGAIGHAAIKNTGATEYLAIPGAVRPDISQSPVTRVDKPDDNLTRLLFNRALKVVGDAGWNTGEPPPDSELAKRTREMNTAFLQKQDFQDFQTPEVRMWRWSAGRASALYFVEVVWINEAQRLPMFAADVVLQGGKPPKIVSFNYRKAEWMRMGEFQDRDWRLAANPEPAFRNAWKVGPDTFVLTYLGGYEGYSVDLQRVDSVKGLTPVLSFGN